MSASQLQLALPARAENVIVVRQAIAGLGEAVGLNGHRLDDLKTVVTEACNNVVVHAYEGEPGPLQVEADAAGDQIQVTVSDRGRGFQPRASEAGASLGLGLPLVASLSDSFAIRGGAGEGTSISVRFSLAETDDFADRGDRDIEPAGEEFALAVAPGSLVRPVVARVIGALAARAEFSVERLSDTVLLGDAVSAHRAEDFHGGRVGIEIVDGDGTLDVRVGPLVEGGGERILGQMEIPGDGGSLRALARSMEITKGETEDGRSAEFLVIAVSN